MGVCEPPAHYHLGRYELAKVIATNTLSIDPSYGNPHLLLGMIADMMDKKQEALSYYEEAKRLNKK